MSNADNNVYDDDSDDCWKLRVNFINHLMTSREGIVSAALKGGDSGYIQRKMIKLMKSIRDPIYDQQDDQ